MSLLLFYHGEHGGRIPTAQAYLPPFDFEDEDILILLLVAMWLKRHR